MKSETDFSRIPLAPGFAGVYARLSEALFVSRCILQAPCKTPAKRGANGERP